MLEKLVSELTAEVRGLRVDMDEMRKELLSAKMKSHYLTMKEACEYLRISRSHMQNLLADGEMPWAIKSGKAWRFPAEKIKKYASAL